MLEFIKTIVSALKTYVDSKFVASKSDWNQNDESAENYIENRTHYDSRKTTEIDESIHLSFDGNMDGMEYVDISNGEGNYLVKISDEPITLEQFLGSTLGIATPDGNQTAPISEENIDDATDAYFVAFDYGIVSSFENNTDISGIIFNKGVWVLCSPDIPVYVSALDKTIITTINEGKLKQIDKKYLPDEIIDSIDELHENVNTVQSTADAAHTLAETNATNLATEISNRETADATKMDKENPAGTGSFSMNRKEDSIIGNNSFATGYNIIASGSASFATGNNTIASGVFSFVGGKYNAEGYIISTSASNGGVSGSSYIIGHIIRGEIVFDSVNGYFILQNVDAGTATYSSIHIGDKYLTPAQYSFATKLDDGSLLIKIYNTVTDKYTNSSSSNGYRYNYQIINIQPNKYVHIIGNGTSDTERSNAHTVDWDGNAWYSGDLFVGGSSMETGTKVLTEKTVANHLTFSDTATGYNYIVEMNNGQLTSYCCCSSIEVTTLPTKTEYVVGETFDSTGMIVTATCQDESTREITNWTIPTIPEITDGVTSVEFNVVYTENGTEYTTTVTLPITVTTTETVEETTEETTE